MANEATFKHDPELGRQVRKNLEEIFSINKTNSSVSLDKTEIKKDLKDLNNQQNPEKVDRSS
jgi:hypothetical protein